MVNMTIAAALVVAQPPSLESRVAKLETEVAAIKWQQVEFSKKLGITPAVKQPLAVPTGKDSLQVQPTVCVDGTCGMPVQAQPMQFQQGGSCGPNGCGPQRSGFRLFGRRGR